MATNDLNFHRLSAFLQFVTRGDFRLKANGSSSRQSGPGPTLNQAGNHIVAIEAKHTATVPPSSLRHRKIHIFHLRHGIDSSRITEFDGRNGRGTQQGESTGDS
jgi:hypothetical protein